MKRILFSLVALLPSVLAAQEAPRPDFEIARDAVAQGAFLPLGPMMARMEREFAGRVLEVELEEDDGLHVYEFEILRSDGRLIEVDVDATTGKVIEVEDEDPDDDADETD